MRHSRENEEISTSVKEELERLAVDTVEEMWREKKKERQKGGVGWRGGDDAWKEVGRRGGTERAAGKQGGREHSLNRDKK